MNLFAEAFSLIFDPASWQGDTGIFQRLLDHLYYTFASLAIAVAVALPIGILVGHTGKGRNVVVAVANAARALPTLGLLFFIVLATGLGVGPLFVVLVVLAIPPILAGAYSGLESVNRATIDAARAMGMTELQVISKVEIPLALPLIVGGIRSAALQVIATATIAGYVGLTGLGRFLVEGIALRNYPVALEGAILVIALALAVDGIFALIQRFVSPRGVSRGAIGNTGTTFRRARPSAAAVATPSKG